MTIPGAFPHRKAGITPRNCQFRALFEENIAAVISRKVSFQRRVLRVTKGAHICGPTAQFHYLRYSSDRRLSRDACIYGCYGTNESVELPGFPPALNVVIVVRSNRGFLCQSCLRSLRKHKSSCSQDARRRSAGEGMEDSS